VAFYTGKLGITSSVGNYGLLGRTKGLKTMADIVWKDVITSSLVKKVILWTANSIRNRSWLGQSGASPPGAIEARDIVHDAIVKTISGTRKWEPDKVTIFQHLIGVVRSDLSHLASGLENRRSRPVSTEKLEHFSSKNALYWMQHQPLCPEQDLYLKELKCKINLALNRDKFAQRVANVMIKEDDSSPPYIANLLKSNNEEVRAAIKRLRRKSSFLLIEADEKPAISGGNDEKIK
jgi:DNA-directed RNA polymerase specialized sigma24 family protein